MSAQRSKTDAADALSLMHFVRAGWLRRSADTVEGRQSPCSSGHARCEFTPPARCTPAVAIAASHRHPVVISHSGLRSFLERLPPCCNGEPMRGNTDAELVAVAQTGGVFGIGFWKEVLGTADVDYIVAAIRHALAVLEAHEGQPPPAPGLRTIKRASQHIGLGSDWDGAVRTAIDAGQIGLITEGLMAAGISEDRIADIIGRNICRVVAQSLAGGSLTFDQALKLCNGG